MPVKNIATDAITAERDASLQDLATTMDEEGIGDLVITEGDEPVGIVTDRDVALAVGQADSLEDLTAEDVMTEDPATIQGDAEAVELPAKMAEATARRIPVVDEDDKLTGIATLDDVVATVGEELEDAATVIETQSPGYSPD